VVVCGYVPFAMASSAIRVSVNMGRLYRCVYQIGLQHAAGKCTAGAMIGLNNILD